MKILLTTRREKFEQRNPIALLDLAAYWRNFGHTLDCYYLDQLKSRKSRRNSYDVVGLSVLQVINESHPIRDALFLKKRFDAEIVIGGKWTQTTTEKERSLLISHGIKVYPGAGENYFTNQEISFGRYPSWDRVDLETLDDARPDIMSTRGCPYHCHFCHNTEKQICFFSPMRTADNIGLLLSHGARKISFCDDIFTLRASHMEGLYNELKRKNINIEGKNEFFTHIKHINPETISWMKAYRPYKISVGVESGDDRILQLMGKGFDSKTAYEKLKMLHEETHLHIGTLFIIGFPGENEDSLRNTLAFIKRISPFAGGWVSYYQPVPGTKGYEMALSRSPKAKLGRRNTSIRYVDPNLSRKHLFKYNYKMMDHAEDNSLRRKVIYSLIQFLPYFVLARIRLIRQNKRLKDLMNN